MIELSRRKLITGLISLVAAPAIVRAGSLMPVKTMLPLLGDGVVAMGSWQAGDVVSMAMDFRNSVVHFRKNQEHWSPPIGFDALDPKAYWSKLR
jgi:hypothetical protein